MLPALAGASQPPAAMPTSGPRRTQHMAWRPLLHVVSPSSGSNGRTPLTGAVSAGSLSRPIAIRIPDSRLARRLDASLIHGRDADQRGRHPRSSNAETTMARAHRYAPDLSRIAVRSASARRARARIDGDTPARNFTTRRDSDSDSLIERIVSEHALTLRPSRRALGWRGAMTAADRSHDELWVCHLGAVPYRDALAIQEHAPRAAPGRRAARHAAAARAPARLHARAALRRRASCRSARTSTAPKASTCRPPTAAGAHLPRPRPARRLSDHAHRRRAPLPAHDGRRDRRRARRGRHRTRARATRRASTTPACGCRSARSPRSACTSRAASPRTASPSTSRTTSSRSPGSSPAGCPTSR